MIKLDPVKWQDIKVSIIQDYGLSTVLIRDRMRRELGFTVREHNEYQRISNQHNSFDYATHTCTICLDFYDDAAETMFRLKYL